LKDHILEILHKFGGSSNSSSSMNELALIVRQPSFKDFYNEC